MKKFLSAISAFALLTCINTSCQKDIDPLQERSQNQELTISATIADNATKVSYEEDGTTHALKPSWQVGDVIIGFDGSGNTYGYSVSSVDGTTKTAVLTIITSGDYAGSKTTNPTNGTKMYMFYAPGKKPSDISSKSLTVSIANQSKDVVPALMMASATVSGSNLSLSFENKTAIIAIKSPKMAAASTSYTSFTLTGAGISTEVKFSLDGSNNLQATYQTAGTITKAVEITSDGSKAVSGVTYIVACPVSSSTDLKFVTNYLETFTKESVTMDGGNYYYMTPTFAGGHNDGLLPGVFSISTTKVAGFSKGNLRYIVSPETWEFYDHQYDFCNTSTYSGHHSDTISLFTWGYNAEQSIVPNGARIDNVDRTSGNLDWYEDWGFTIGNTITWRTLTTAEWQYLFGTNTERSDKYRYGVKVAGKTNCVVLYPDGFGGTKVSNGNTTIYDTVEKWAAAEAQGVVCLPAAGCRFAYPSEQEPEKIIGFYNIGNAGYYWSSTAYDKDKAYSLEFNQDAGPGRYDARKLGYSVRLVTTR